MPEEINIPIRRLYILGGTPFCELQWKNNFSVLRFYHFWMKIIYDRRAKEMKIELQSNDFIGESFIGCCCFFTTTTKWWKSVTHYMNISELNQITFNNFVPNYEGSKIYKNIITSDNEYYISEVHQIKNYFIFPFKSRVIIGYLANYEEEDDISDIMFLFVNQLLKDLYYNNWSEVVYF